MRQVKIKIKVKVNGVGQVCPAHTGFSHLLTLLLATYPQSWKQALSLPVSSPSARYAVRC
jgi:hypothetical protein